MTASSAAGCRFCKVPLTRTFLDLGMSPLCRTHLEGRELNQGEEFYPLHVLLCENCLLAQLQQYVTPDQSLEAAVQDGRRLLDPKSVATYEGIGLG